MTPEEFKALKKPSLAASYMSEEDKVSWVTAAQSLTSANRTAIQRALEANDGARLLRYWQRARMELVAEPLAETRLDEIIADGKIDIATEIDELLGV